MKQNTKILALILVISMFMTSGVFAITFTDTTNSKNAEAINTLAGLGIMQGYEDGTFKPEEKITRAEYSAIVARIMGMQDIGGSSEGKGLFHDVPATHWAFNYINYLSALSLISGYGDGNFGPEDQVTLEQAIKIIVEALGYGAFAKTSAYPTGYIAKANELGLLKGLSGVTYSSPTTRQLIAQLIYNSIDVEVYVQTSVGNEKVVYEKKENVLSEYMGINIFKGRVIENELTSLSSNSYLPDGQIKMKVTKTNEEVILYSNDEDYSDLIGLRVYAYAKEDDNGENQILFVKEDTENNSILEITSKQFDKYSDRKIHYYRNPDNKEKVDTAEVLFSADFIYNGAYVEFSEDYLNIKSGKMTLIDSDNDKIYDIVKIDSFKTVVVETFSKASNLIVDRYSASNNVIYNDTDVDSVSELIKFGGNLTIDVLEKNDVLEVYQSPNTAGKKVNKIKVIDESIEGKINEITEDTIVINQEVYELSQYFIDNQLGASIPMDKELTFKLDSQGRVVAPSEKNNSALEYGYLVTAKMTSTYEDSITLRIFTKNGIMTDYDLDSKITIDRRQITDLSQVLSILRAAKKAPSTSDDLSQVIKFAYNSNNLITKIDTSLTNASNNSSEDYEKLVDEYGSQVEYVYGGNAFNGKLLGNSTVVFRVPTDKTDKASYGVTNSLGLSVESKYKLYGYDMNKSGILGCVVVEGDPVIEINNDDPLYMVDKITDFVQADGEIAKKLYAINAKAGSVAVQYIITEKTKLQEFGAQGGTIIQNPLLNVPEAYPLFKGDVLRLAVTNNKIEKVERMFSINHFRANKYSVNPSAAYEGQVNSNGAIGYTDYAYLLRFVTAKILYKGSLTAQGLIVNSNPESNLYWTFEGNPKFGNANFVTYEENESGVAKIRKGGFNDFIDNETGKPKASYMFAKSRYGTLQEVFVYNFNTDPYPTIPKVEE